MNKLSNLCKKFFETPVLLLLILIVLITLAICEKKSQALEQSSDIQTTVLTTAENETVPVVENPFVIVANAASTTNTNTKKTSTKTTKKKTTKTKYYDVPLSHKVQDHIFKTCKKASIDPRLVIAIIWKESNYKASAVGDHGNSVGLMQIQPRWCKEKMKKLKCPDLKDPYQNITVGVSILKDYINKGKGIKWALMAYNGGPSYANRKASRGEVSEYARKVLAKKASLKTG